MRTQRKVIKQWKIDTIQWYNQSSSSNAILGIVFVCHFILLGIVYVQKGKELTIELPYVSTSEVKHK